MCDFKTLESAAVGSEFSLAKTLDNLNYNSDGLVPAIAQQFDTREVLMMAWMNRPAIEESLETGRVCYWSRSRQSFWRKGESSGQVQLLKAMAFDCDGDTVLLQVDQTGPACHTGRRNCFYVEAVGDKVVIAAEPLIDPEELYK